MKTLKLHTVLITAMSIAAFMTISSTVNAATITAYEYKCIDVTGGSTANGVQAQIWACHGGFNQQWNIVGGQIKGIGTSEYAGVNKCLDVRGFGTANGTPVQMWDCHGGNNQKWRIDQLGRIIGVQSGRCLDVTGASTANGAPLQIWDCHLGSNQRWKVR